MYFPVSDNQALTVYTQNSRYYLYTHNGFIMMRSDNPSIAPSIVAGVAVDLGSNVVGITELLREYLFSESFEDFGVKLLARMLNGRQMVLRLEPNDSFWTTSTIAGVAGGEPLVEALA